MTRTYSTARIVVDGFWACVWVEDFSYTTPEQERPDREYSKFNREAFSETDFPIDGAHVRKFDTLHEASVWLFERGAVIGEAWFWEK